jgi:ADP-ribose pyrophosphatase
VGTFRLLRTSRTAEAGFLAVDELDFETPDGETIRRTVVRHPGAVVVVPIEPDGATAVLVRQFRAAVGDHLLELPAGKRDVEHESPAATAARELEEELGLIPGRLVKVSEFYNSPGFCDEHSYVFVALELRAAADGTAPTSPEERDMTEERVALDEVEPLIATGAIRDAKTIIGLLLARQYLAGELAGTEAAW